MLTERIGALSGRVAVIRVGAATPAELKELRHRVEDALAATRAAMAEGIVAGGGAALLHAMPALDGAGGRRGRDRGLQDRGRDRAAGASAEPGDADRVQRGLSRPPMWSSGLGALGPDDGFDALGRAAREHDLDGHRRPAARRPCGLQNGASVAGLLLTTNTLVAEEQTPWGGSAPP